MLNLEHLEYMSRVQRLSESRFPIARGNANDEPSVLPSEWVPHDDIVTTNMYATKTICPSPPLPRQNLCRDVRVKMVFYVGYISVSYTSLGDIYIKL